MKRFEKIFSICFLLLCTLPMILLLWNGPAASSANQVLDDAPSLTNRDGSFNSHYLTDLSNYVGQRFGLRQELITLHAHLIASIFQESATDSVILGQEGWLFYSETLADYQGTAPLSDRDLWAAARTLSLIQEQAAAQGAEFLFVVAPNKNTLYPTYMPERYAATSKLSNWDRLQVALTHQGVAYVNLEPVLLSQPEPVYYCTDSHWTPFGSALAHDAILSALGRPTALAQEAFREDTHVGDLQEMLYPSSPVAELSPILARARTFSYVDAFRSPEDMTIRTTSSSGTGSLLMFRDSFGNTLYADMAESFSHACFSRAMPIRMDLVTSEAADTLVLELVERNLSWLVTKPPIMAAPRREPVTAAQVFAEPVTVRVQKTTILDGLVCYTGELPQTDDTAPIYMSLDGTFYEATPGQDGAFTLYAPAAAEMFLYSQQNGQWYACPGQPE